MAQTMTEPAGPPRPARAGHGWAWFLGLGLLLVVLGAVGAGSSLLGTISGLVLAVLLMAAGIGQVILAFLAPRWKGRTVHLMGAGLDLVIGVLILTRPEKSISDFALLLAALLMAGGLQRALGSWALRFPAWGWSLASGALGLLLGVSVASGWAAEPWLIALFVAVDFLLHGACWVLVALFARTPWPDDEGPAAGVGTP